MTANPDLWAEAERSRYRALFPPRPGAYPLLWVAFWGLAGFGGVAAAGFPIALISRRVPDALPWAATAGVLTLILYELSLAVVLTAGARRKLASSGKRPTLLAVLTHDWTAVWAMGMLGIVLAGWPLALGTVAGFLAYSAA